MTAAKISLIPLLTLFTIALSRVKVMPFRDCLSAFRTCPVSGVPVMGRMPRCSHSVVVKVRRHTPIPKERIVSTLTTHGGAAVWWSCSGSHDPVLPGYRSHPTVVLVERYAFHN